MARTPDLSTLLDAIDPDAPMAQRHLWLIDLLQWVRGDARDPAASVSRVRLLLDAAQARPDWRARWQAWWQRFQQTVDLTPLLADFGFAPRTAFMSEFGHRLRRKLLPGTPETTDLTELFALLLPTRFDARWIQALDRDTLQRLRLLLLAPGGPKDAPAGEPDSPWQAALLDALTFSISQVSATGFASEIRTRMSEPARAARSFHALPAHYESLRRAVLQQLAAAGPELELGADERGLLGAPEQLVAVVVDAGVGVDQQREFFGHRLSEAAPQRGGGCALA